LVFKNFDLIGLRTFFYPGTNPTEKERNLEVGIRFAEQIGFLMIAIFLE
jgi:hypothetical protein